MKFGLFVVLLWCVACNYQESTYNEEMVNVQIENKNNEIETSYSNAIPQIHNSNQLNVIFENQSGRKVQLWWDDYKNGILQIEIENESQETIQTYIGHSFYFTNIHNPQHKLYYITMVEHIDHIILYNDKIMKDRDIKFEQEKNIWMKNYYQQTGKTWKNFYPRNPVIHYYYNISYINQIFNITSKQNYYYNCTNHNNIIEFIQQQPSNNHSISSTPPFTKLFIDSNQHIEIIQHNNDYLCRNLDNNNENILNFQLQVLCTEPKLILIKNFLSEDECDHIINIGKQIGLMRSTVSQQAIQSKDRTSSTQWLDRDMSHIINHIVKRISDIISINEQKLFINQSSESLQLVHYHEGELYYMHHDYGTDRPNNRFITFLMYLNNVQQGGETSFPSASKQCLDKFNYTTQQGYFGLHPGKGNVLFFYNLFPDGNVDPSTLHFAEPPIKGEKWMTNLWIWDPVFS